MVQLEAHGLTKIYSEKRGLLPINFKAAKGEFIAVVGPNGAGKSTLLKLLANWLVPDKGSVLVNGINIKDRPAVARRVGFVPETPNLFDSFSVEYNLRLFARLFQVPFSRVEDILKQVNLLKFRHNAVQVLSKGLKQRVSISRSLLADPGVLLFDEPTAGLDFEMTKEIYRLLKNIYSAEKTILFTSHRHEEIKTLATRVIALNEGNMAFDGDPKGYF